MAGGPTLGAAVVDITANMQPLKNEMGGWREEARQQGEAIGSAFGLGFASPVLNAIGAVDQLTGGLREAASFASQVTGVGFASQMQVISQSLRSLTGSAEEARQLTDNLEALSEKTLLDPGPLVAYSRQLIGIGIAANRVTADLQAMADVNQALTGGDASKMQQLVTLMTRLRGGETVNPRQFRTLLGEGLNLDRVVAAGTGRTIASGTGGSILSGMNPRAAYDTLEKGFEIVYGGAAQAAAEGTLAGITQSTQTALAKAMEPTGKALLPVLQTGTGYLKRLADGFGKLNEVTGGSAGLTLVVGVATVAVQKWGGSLVAGVAATRNLTAAVTDYAIAAQAAANIKPPVSPGAAGIGSAGAGALGAEAAGGTAALGSEAAAGAGALGTITIGKRAFDVLSIGKTIGTGLLSLLPLGMSLGLGYLATRYAASGNQKASHIAGGAATGVGYGSLIGTILGGAIGAGIGFFADGVGAIPGAMLGARWGNLIGGALGGGIGAYSGSRQATSAAKTASAADKISAAVDKFASAVDRHSSVLGGGSRARSAVEALDAEYAFARGFSGQAG